MKATGIVRLVDDLGRVLIPKEIRRACNIREGDALEIFLQDGAVVFEKYNPGYRDDLMATLQDAADNYDNYECNDFPNDDYTLPCDHCINQDCMRCKYTW